MPALATLTINDGQATPVAHSFTPLSIDSGGVATFIDRTGGIPIGFCKLDLSLRQPPAAKTGQNSSGRVYKATLRLFVPTLEQTSASTSTGIQPAPTKAFDHMATVQFFLPERGTTQNRKDLLALVTNALSDATIETVVTELEPFY
ncbi:coat protein [ssRNA phage SRR6960551_10]|uniref:Coat protein n=1 Tax=ssRNA phage SRR6960551_10 TaxID=2786548 RepID=A0A8S5L597_9VIRU|nr:coat protein [ssRNA phage SRR6960551_10]DAD52620.1 TPA_asm: coat protein [ssRNA phage SRR6960551_10]